jgi:2'-5' RNA ligase
LKCVEKENIHITLRFLGEIPESMTEKVADLVRTISFQSLVLSFEGVGVFPAPSRPSVVWVGIDGDVPSLLNVFSELEKGLSSLGFDKERRPFQPHLTLCRVKSGRNRSQLIDAVKSMEGKHFGQLRVDRIRLKKSVLTRAGPVYSTLAESRLG